MSGYLKRSKLFLCQSSSWKQFRDWTSQNETVGTNLILLIAGSYCSVKCQRSLLGVCFSAVFIDSNTHPCQPPFCVIKMPNFTLTSHYNVGSCFSHHFNFRSLFLGRGDQAEALAHKVLHGCLVIQTLVLLQPLWDYLVWCSLRLLLFMLMLQCWPFVTLEVTHSPGLFSVPLSLNSS